MPKDQIDNTTISPEIMSTINKLKNQMENPSETSKILSFVHSNGVEYKFKGEFEYLVTPDDFLSQLRKNFSPFIPPTKYETNTIIISPPIERAKSKEHCVIIYKKPGDSDDCIKEHIYHFTPALNEENKITHFSIENRSEIEENKDNMPFSGEGAYEYQNN